MAVYTKRIHELYNSGVTNKSEIGRIIAKEFNLNSNENTMRVTVSRILNKADDCEGVTDACESLGINPAAVPYMWLKSKEASLFIKNPNYRVESIDYDKIIAECMDGYVPLVKQYVHPVNSFDRLIWTDVHVGMDASRKGLALYATDWNAEVLNKQIDEMVSFVVGNKKSDYLIIDELGDYMDGWDGETTRKGHKLPQNMTNEEAFEVGLKAKMLLIDKLANVYKHITCNNMCEDNHCFDDKTEVLTNDGWKYFLDVLDTDKIATFNGSHVEYQSPLRKIYNPINNTVKMHSYSSKLVDVMVTSKHRMYVKRNKYNKSNESFEYIYSDILDKSGEVKFKTSISSGNSEYEIHDDLIRLVAWILTDGTITKRKSYVIYQSKDVAPILNILDNLNINYNISEKKQSEKITIRGRDVKSTKDIMWAISINEKNSGSDVMDSLNSVVSKKEIPEWVYKLSDRQFRIFLDSYVDGDGSRSVDTSCTIYGKNEILSELQAACAVHGHRSNLSVNNRGDSVLSVVYDRQEASFKMKNFKEEEIYVDYTWCFTLPNSNMFVRRNGKVSIQGNSGAFGYVVNAAFKHIVDCKHSNVTVINHQRFLNHYIIGDHGFIISHGKDSRNLKFGFKPQLDPRGSEKISQYIRHNEELRRCKFIEFSKGDSHQCLFDMCTSDEFDYFNYPAFSPSSEWVQTNFKKGRSGFVFQNVDMHSDRKIITPYFF